MIVTDLAHMNHQVPMTPSLRKAFEFLLRPDLASLPDGRTDIDGDRVFALVQRYETLHTETPKFEYHRKYIDVQFIASGQEVIGWASAGAMSVTEAYDAGKDICFGTVAQGRWTPVRLETGQLMVLWPEDAHAPKGAAGGPSKVMKVVIKAAV
ncbi:MAG: YhcH/YjgK/YiaL family protein [Nitrospirota bacterium]